MARLLVDSTRFVTELKSIFSAFPAKPPVLTVDDHRTVEVGGLLYISATVSFIKDIVPLRDEIDISFLNTVHLPTIPLQTYWENEKARWRRVIDALNQGLQGIRATLRPVDDGYFQLMDLQDCRSGQDIGELSFYIVISVQHPQNRGVTYVSQSYRPISLSRVLTPQQLKELWGKVTRAETWHDRKPLF